MDGDDEPFNGLVKIVEHIRLETRAQGEVKSREWLHDLVSMQASEIAGPVGALVSILDSSRSVEIGALHLGTEDDLAVFRQEVALFLGHVEEAMKTHGVKIPDLLGTSDWTRAASLIHWNAEKRSGLESHVNAGKMRTSRGQTPLDGLSRVFDPPGPDHGGNYL